MEKEEFLQRFHQTYKKGDIIHLKNGRRYRWEEGEVKYHEETAEMCPCISIGLFHMLTKSIILTKPIKTHKGNIGGIEVNIIDREPEFDNEVIDKVASRYTSCMTGKLDKEIFDEKYTLEESNTEACVTVPVEAGTHLVITKDGAVMYKGEETTVFKGTGEISIKLIK
jgi:hypothetical protein